VFSLVLPNDLEHWNLAIGLVSYAASGRFDRGRTDLAPMVVISSVFFQPFRARCAGPACR